MQSTLDFSIVSPVYGCPDALEELCRRVTDTVEPLGTYEIILVFDCSRDNSWEIMCNLAAADPHIKCVRLARNFGQHYAITAGLSHTSGQWVVVMDCDLQDQPEEIPRLYAKAQEGYDTVCAQRAERQDSFFKRLGSTAFYRVLAYMTDTEQDVSIANFGIYHHKVIRSILAMGDHIRYFPAMVQWVGFQRTAIPVTHAARANGGSSYSLRRLFSLAFDNIIAFSDKPLRLTVKIGGLMSLLSFCIAIFYFVSFMAGAITEPGYASIILSIWLLGSMHIFVLGMVGVYLGYVFERVKDRPIYLVKDRLNFPEYEEPQRMEQGDLSTSCATESRKLSPPSCNSA